MKWSSTEIATIMIAMTMAAKVTGSNLKEWECNIRYITQTVTPKNKEEGASKRASRIERNQTQTRDPEIGGGQTENECGRKVNYHNVSA